MQKIWFFFLLPEKRYKVYAWQQWVTIISIDHQVKPMQLIYSPFDPAKVGFEASYSRFETLADTFSLVFLQKIIGFGDDCQTGQDYKSNGPLEIQYTGCDEVCHITW